MTIDIRPIAMGDVDGFHRAVDTVALERRFLSTGQAHPFDSTAHFVANNIMTGNPQFVALAGNEVVGWCDVCRHQKPFFSHCGVLGMGVIQPYRGQGIGTRLLDMTLAAAFERGLTRVELEVFSTNAVAASLYRRRGFQLEGTRRGAAVIDGVAIDIDVMAIRRERLDQWANELERVKGIEPSS